MRKAIELTPLNIELIRRFAKNIDEDDFKASLNWLADGITQVKTETAFQLAKGGRAVFQIYADGTDTQLDDLESEREYYPDLSKTYPEIETIFIVEGDL